MDFQHLGLLIFQHSFSFPYLVTDVYSCILRSRFSCTSIFSYSCLFSLGEYSLTDKCLRTIFHLRNICLSESDQRILNMKPVILPNNRAEGITSDGRIFYHDIASKGMYSATPSVSLNRLGG